MEIGTGLASNSDARRFGRYYRDLLNDQAWVRRRVETIQILDENLIDRSITLDIDGAELRRRANSHGLRRMGRLPVPLETLEKALQLDLDVRDAANAPIPVTTSDEDSKLAHAFLLETLRHHGVPLGSLTLNARRELFLLVRGPSMERLEEIANRVLDPFYVHDPSFHIALSPSDLACWTNLLYLPETREVLLQIATTYVFAGQIDVRPSTTIIKFRYREEIATGEQVNLGTQLGYRAAGLVVPARGVGTAQREHLRVSVPDGGFISRARLALELQEMPDDRYGLRQTARRAVVYTRGLDKDRYTIFVRVRPRLGSFFIPALGTVAFMSALMAAGWYLEETSNRFSTNVQNADAAVAIIALIPSIMAIYFARVGEHRMVGRLHVMPRLFLLGAGLAAVAVAGAVATEMSHEHILGAFTLALYVAGGLVVYFGSVVITVLGAHGLSRLRHPSFPRK